MDAEVSSYYQRDKRRKDDEIAVGSVNEPHHPKDERETRGKKCVESAEKYSIQHRGDQIHGVTFRNKLWLFLRVPGPAAGPPAPPVLPARSKRGLRPPWPA